MNHNRMPTYILGAAALAAVLVIAGVPLVGLLPFALLLACPLMMVLMMKSMSGGARDESDGRGGADRYRLMAGGE